MLRAKDPEYVANRPPAGHWLASFALAVAALALFVLLPQRTLHGVDGNQFVVWIEEGHYDYPRHIGYLHACGLVHEMLARFGQPGGFLALRIASALGAAFGLFAVHRAFLRFLPGQHRSAAIAGIAVLLTPAWFFYATTAEIPGVFAAGAGLSWWLFARWLDAPSMVRAAALGAGCAAAGGLHSFGHLLTPSFVAIAWLWGRAPARGRWAQFALLAAVHAAIALSLPKLLGAGAAGQARDAVGHLEERWRTFAPSTTPIVFFREWIAPYAPWSVLALLGCLLPRPRRFAGAVLLLLLHLPFNVLLLGYEQIDESGAYLIALLPPAVLATLQLVPARALWPLVATTAALAVHLSAPGWQPPVAASFADGVAELHRERKIALVVADKAELDGARTAVPGLMVMNLAEVYGAFVQTRKQGQTFAAWFDEWFTTFGALGMPIVWSDSTRRFFDENGDPELRTFWTGHVPVRYRVTPVERRGFRGVWIEAR
jgi:hypothetical protein